MVQAGELFLPLVSDDSSSFRGKILLGNVQGAASGLFLKKWEFPGKAAAAGIGKQQKQGTRKGGAGDGKLRQLKPDRAAESVEKSVEETLPYLDFPCEHRSRLRTNNGLERIMKEIRRRTRAGGSFPDGCSAMTPGGQDSGTFPRRCIWGEMCLSSVVFSCFSDVVEIIAFFTVLPTDLGIGRQRFGDIDADD